MSWCEDERIDAHQTIILFALRRFLAQLHFRGRRRGRRRRCEQRRDRRKQKRDTVSNSSWFHFKMAATQVLKLDVTSL